MIIHILKDGTQVNSVEGIVISQDEHPQVYKVIREIEERGGVGHKYNEAV